MNDHPSGPQPQPETPENLGETAQGPATKPAEPPHFPPPAMHQTPYQMMPPEPRKGRFKEGFGLGFGFGLGVTIMLTVLSTITGLISMAFVAILASTLGNISGDATMETTTVWGSDTATHKLRAIDIKGPILTASSGGGLFTSATYGYEVADQLDSLSKDDADGVVLLVDTPGGSITGSRAIADAVVRYQKRTGYKVLVHVEGMSASGGVFSTATADEIISDYGTLVGSIGVIFGPFQRFEKVTSFGSLLGGSVTADSITQEYLTAGKDKDFGNPFRDMSAEEREALTKGLMVEYDNFVNFVSEHRNIPAATIKNEFGAHVFDAETAKQNGLVDDVMNREDFFRHAAKTAGADPEDTKVFSVKPPSGLSALLGAKRMWGSALPLTPQAGQPVVPAQEICGRTSPLVFAGDLNAVCGR